MLVSLRGQRIKCWWKAISLFVFFVYIQQLSKETKQACIGYHGGGKNEGNIEVFTNCFPLYHPCIHPGFACTADNLRDKKKGVPDPLFFLKLTIG